MKKLMLSAIVFTLTACSTPVQQSSVPMDMQTVQEYQQRVANAHNNVQRTQEQAEMWALNQSDHRPKVVVTQPRVYPSVHYGYSWGRHPRHYSGVGVRLGHYHYY